MAWDELIVISDDDDAIRILSFHEAVTQVEGILLDSDSTHADYVEANGIASSINEMNEENDMCEDKNNEEDEG